MSAATTPSPSRIDFYWRPGCGFCSMLRRKLDKLGVERVEHNIWDDPVAASVVRSYARGNETVPTVVVGDIGLVNPTADELLSVLADEAPHLLPDDVEPAPPSRVGRMMQRVLGG